MVNRLKQHLRGHHVSQKRIALPQGISGRDLTNWLGQAPRSSPQLSSVVEAQIDRAVAAYLIERLAAQASAKEKALEQAQQRSQPVVLRLTVGAAAAGGVGVSAALATPRDLLRGYMRAHPDVTYTELVRQIAAACEGMHLSVTRVVPTVLSRWARGKLAEESLAVFKALSS